jgi:RNA-directed DNA polymerase
VLKTDIKSFFDQISRPILKAKVAQALKGNSLQSLIFDVTDCEVNLKTQDKDKLKCKGIIYGLGIRQGMPLSPLLANLALAEFDDHVEGRDIRMVRYADDLALFFRTKEEAKDGFKYVKLLLSTFKLSIPEIESRSKTLIVAKSDPLEFLGREIVFLDSSNCYVNRIGKRQIDKITNRLISELSLKGQLSRDRTLQDTIEGLAKSSAAYLGIYRGAHNYSSFEEILKGVRRLILADIFRDLFGHECLQSLSPEAKKFLGIDIWDALEPNVELDV